MQIPVAEAPHRSNGCGALPALSMLVVIGTIWTIMTRPAPVIVWNLSASAPKGIYHVSRGKPAHKGELVVAHIQGPLRDLAARRRYLPADIPLIKRIAAEHPDHLCTRGNVIHVNGRAVARQLAQDALGRPLPRWNGCRVLLRHEVLLLMDAPTSFDGRYFGPLKLSAVEGRAQPLWTW